MNKYIDSNYLPLQGDIEMKAVKVQYTVRENYVETNKKNIKAVVSELRNMGDKGVKYSVFTEDNGQSFVHFAIYREKLQLK